MKFRFEHGRGSGELGSVPCNREIIANALDEQLITGTQKIEIYQTDIGWGIRDFGRGIQIDHFTQNENPEKYSGPEGIIGKFGVGLKDALATFHRNGITSY